jgi:hypothetical protein
VENELSVCDKSVGAHLQLKKGGLRLLRVLHSAHTGAQDTLQLALLPQGRITTVIMRAVAITAIKAVQPLVFKHLHIQFVRHDDIDYRSYKSGKLRPSLLSSLHACDTIACMLCSNAASLRNSMRAKHLASMNVRQEEIALGWPPGLTCTAGVVPQTKSPRFRDLFAAGLHIRLDRQLSNFFLRVPADLHCGLVHV